MKVRCKRCGASFPVEPPQASGAVYATPATHLTGERTRFRSRSRGSYSSDGRRVTSCAIFANAHRNVKPTLSDSGTVYNARFVPGGGL